MLSYTAARAAPAALLLCVVAVVGAYFNHRRLRERRAKAVVSLLELVKQSTSYVMQQARDVTIDKQSIKAIVCRIDEALLTSMMAPNAFDSALHYADGTWRTVQYLLVVDALNFCFWPGTCSCHDMCSRIGVLQSIVASKRRPAHFAMMDRDPNSLVLHVIQRKKDNMSAAAGMEYEHLAMGLKDAVLLHGERVLSAERLAQVSAEEVREFFGWTRELPQEAERVRVVQEEEFAPIVVAAALRLNRIQIGKGLLAYYDGRAANLVRAAHNSAHELVRLVTAHFPAFRDQAVYKGRQVFFLKRAQIFVADVHGAFRGRGLGRFDDIADLTMFADYRVPVVLRKQHVLKYSDALQRKVDNKEELLPGSPEELEIRAASIQAVERIRASIEALHGRDLTPAAFQIDWYLWQLGEDNRASDPPHHRTLTTNY